MTLRDYRTYFKQSLASIYPDTEIHSFFYLLVAHYLELQRIDVSLQPDFEIEQAKLNLLDTALNRLKNEEPIQYILGKTEFYGLPFVVDKNVLVPRPETEELVDWVLNYIKSSPTNIALKVLDIGTGSGCIPVSIAKNNSNTIVSAIDISSKALGVAQQNAQDNDVIINFIQADILNTTALPETYDIIISNPPYVRELEKQEIKKNVLDHEPHLALFVKDHDPLLFYDAIADLAKNHLSEKGALFFEINQYLGKETVTLLEQKGFSNVELRKDLFGNDRMISAIL